MESSGSMNEDDFVENSSASDEVYRQELEAQMENIDIDDGNGGINNIRQQLSKINPKTAFLVIGGVVLLLAAVVAVVLLVNKFGEKSEAAKVENVQRLANRYAHYVVDGNIDDDSDIEYKEMDGSLYIEKIFDSKTKKAERENFVKEVSNIQDELRKNISENEDKYECSEYCLRFLDTNNVMVGIINDYSNFDYNLSNFTKVYVEGGNDALLKIFEDGYKDIKKSFDIFEDLLTDDATIEEEVDSAEDANDASNPNGTESSESNDESEDDNSAIADSVEKMTEEDNEKINFYVSNLKYEESLSSLLDLYSAYNCFTSTNELDANCKVSVDTSATGLFINEELTNAMTEIKQSIENYLNHVVVRSQWIAENLKEENG